ncbi:hypothetical protein ACFE04_025184 [Oxalis oulophora]
MADNKLDLPDDLLSSKPSDHSWTSKLEVSGGKTDFDDSKDQGAIDSTIPLSPQWLYTKPNEPKLDVRSSLPTDPSQKEGWRLDGTDDKKDWRRIATENEGSRRWREEERETGLLTGRNRRKTERNVPVREATENRTLPSSDRWHDANARRDNKWSSRWGPDDKEKEGRTEKKPEVDKEKEKDKDKEDAHNDNQNTIANNRSASEKETESRDNKWRPRHRMEVHASSYRAAPGFGAERGRVEGSNLGFTLGRGRSNALGRSAGPAGSLLSGKSDGVPGKPSFSSETFCYPRGKLLDIYRRQKLDPSFGFMSAEMVEAPSITKSDVVEPLAVVTPDAEEHATLNDIWKGKITNSEVVYNSTLERRSTEDFIEFPDGKHDFYTLGDNIPNEALHDGAYECGDTGKAIKQEPQHKTSGKHLALDLNDSTWTAPENNGVYSGGLINESYQMVDDASMNKWDYEDNSSAVPFTASRLPDDSNNSYVMGHSNEAKDIEIDSFHQDISLCYVDPHGVIQGPFSGADIILWFEEGYFKTDLPVRLADAPEETPFRELGEVMPHLKAGKRDADVNPNPVVEQSSAFEGTVDVVGLHSSAQKGRSPDSAMPDLNSFSGQLAQSKLSEPELPLQLPRSEGLSFNDYIAHDEEILFSGRPNNNSYGIGKSAESTHDTLPNSFNQPPVRNELPEPILDNQMDNKLHPFGLLWSELEGAQARQKQASSIPSNMGKTSGFGAMVDQFPNAEQWSDYRKNTLPDPNVYQEAAHLMSHIDQETKHFDLAEQLMSRQFQQQQQENMLLPPHARLNDSMLLDQLLHNQIPDAGLGQPHIDPRSNNIHALMEHQRMLDIQQQRSNHPSRHFLPTIEQQHLHGKYGQAPPQQDNQRDLFELISRQHGQMQALEQQALLQEQLQARQQLMGLRQRANEEDRHLDSVWPGDETDQFLRLQRGLSSGFGPLDFYQQQQRPHMEDQLGHLERSLSVQERLRQGQFEHGSVPFDRSMPLPTAGSGVNLDVMNAIARGQSLDMQELNARLQSGGQFGNLASGVRPPNSHQHHMGPNQFHSSHLDASEGRWSERNEQQLQNEWMESRIQQLNINAERQRDSKLASDDLNMWMSHGSNDDKSRQLLVELLRQKSGHQAAEIPNTNEPLDRRTIPGHGHFSASSSLDHPSNVFMEQEAAGINDKFSVGSYGSTSSRGGFTDQQTNAYPDGELSLPGLNRTAQAGYEDPNLISMSSLTKDLPEMEMTNRNEGMIKGVVFEDQDKSAGLAPMNHGEIPVNSLSRHSSFGGNVSLYSERTGAPSSFPEDIAAERVSMASKGQQDTILLRRPPVSRTSASQEALSDLAFVRGKTPSVDAGRRESSGINVQQNQQGSESAKKDNMRFRRTSSCSDTDVSEASFIDMLKSNVKKPPATSDVHSAAAAAAEPADQAQASRGGKKKGKKGRQIDPALLGFKVTSNRIMMGEIQRIED